MYYINKYIFWGIFVFLFKSTIKLYQAFWMNWFVQMIHVNELVQKQDIVSVCCVLLAALSVVG